MKQSTKPTLRALACAIASLPILTGCGHLTTLFGADEEASIDVTAVACRSFKPITWADGDTDATLAQIHEHNAAYLAICGEGER